VIIKLESINHEVSLEEARDLVEELSALFKDQVDENSSRSSERLHTMEERLNALARERTPIGPVKTYKYAYQKELEDACTRWRVSRTGDGELLC
jgi:pantothenate kinase